MPFHPATSESLQAVRQRLSHIRLAPYDLAAHGNQLGSLQLYEWNSEASAACYAGLQVVEIILRNAIHEQLTELHTSRGLAGSWPDDPLQLLERRCREDIALVRSRLRRAGKPVTADRIVSELTFGFWRYLLSSRYKDSLWTTVLWRAFPRLSPHRRESIAELVEQLHKLRNRIAHHEPIHTRDLMADYHRMMKVIDAICPDTHEWAKDLNRIPRAVARRSLFGIPKQWVQTTAPGVWRLAPTDQAARSTTTSQRDSNA